MKKLNVKKDDTVVVISGKDKGKQGKVLTAFPAEERVVVQGANMVTRHRKPRKQGEAGGRIEHEGTINASNVMLVCPKLWTAIRRYAFAKSAERTSTEAGGKENGKERHSRSGTRQEEKERC